MGRTTPPPAGEKEFLLSALREGIRVDGRAPYDIRKISITVGPSLGQCEVKWGATRVMAAVSCRVAEPTEDRPTEGFLRFYFDYSAMAGPHAMDREARGISADVGRFVERSLREARTVDTESLCISAGRKVWSIRVDVRVLDDEGNAFDSAHLAAIVALKHFQRPDVTIAGEEITIYPLDRRDPVPLTIHHTPMSISFGMMDDEEMVVADPCRLEEEVMVGRISFSINAQKELCCIEKSGGAGMPVETVSLCSRIALMKSSKLMELVESALAIDAQRRRAKKERSQQGPSALHIQHPVTVHEQPLEEEDGSVDKVAITKVPDYRINKEEEEEDKAIPMDDSEEEETVVLHADVDQRVSQGVIPQQDLAQLTAAAKAVEQGAVNLAEAATKKKKKKRKRKKKVA